MANLFKLGTTMRDAACNGIVDAIDGGTPPGRLEHSRAGRGQILHPRVGIAWRPYY